jgi:hypothetical protein
MLRLAPLALVLVAVVAPARADDPQRAQRVTRVFPVADLVVPIEDYAAPPLSGPMTPACPAIQACPAAANCPAAPAQSCPTTPKCETACPSSKQTLQDKLISLIQNVVSPNSWSNVGGSGTIDYMPIGHGLVISQTPDVHEQVVDLLETLRRLQNHQVSFEVRLPPSRAITSTKSSACS